MKIDLLKSLPKIKKPIKIRRRVTEIDRVKSWYLNKYYFDGNRKQGYGGYKYDGRWKPVAKDFIDHYKLSNKSKILDIGCAKGFLIYEFQKLLKKSEVVGLDISSYAILAPDTPKIIRKNLIIGNANYLPFEDNYFDLVISINTLHNILDVNDVARALKEIKRVSKKNSFISVGSYDNNKEKNILDNWAVVASCYMSSRQWLRLFEKVKYYGDYNWFKPK
jgi:ubiquinone/menaquinone biosynthesis C-methylase UbiE